MTRSTRRSSARSAPGRSSTAQRTGERSARSARSARKTEPTIAAADADDPVLEQLNAKQQRFCEEYLIDLNATRAYERAYGATGKTAEANGCRLLGNAKVATRVAELIAERSARTRITSDHVLEELGRVGFSDMRSFTTWGPSGVSLKASDTLDEDAARCVSEVSETTTKEGGSLKFKLHDKVGALTLLGKHLGLFADRHEHTGRDGGPIEVRDLSDAERAEQVVALLQRAEMRRRGVA